MLQRIEWNVRRVRGLSFRREWVRPTVLLALAAILTRIQPTAGVAPLAQALLAAGLFAGIDPAAILIGCGFGAWNGGWNLIAPLSALAAWCGYYGARLIFEKLLNERRFRGEGATAALAAASVLAVGVPATLGDPMRCAVTLFGAAGAAVTAPFFAAAIRLTPTRRHLMPEERAGLALLALSALAGIHSLWRPLGVALSAAAVLLTVPMGAGAAACTGLAAGATLAATGADFANIALFGAIGLICGFFSARKRWLAAAILCGLAWAAVFLQKWTPWNGVAAAVGCACALAIPPKLAERVRKWASDEQTACDPDRLARCLRAESADRLTAMSEAFGEMAERCREPVTAPDEQTLICEMRQRLCEGCTRYADCWAGDSNRAVRFLCQLISQAVDWSGGDCAEPLFPDEMPPDALRACARGRSIPSRLGMLLEDFAGERRQAQRRGTANQRVAAQFLQAQALLSGLAEGQAQPIRVRGSMAARARSALDRAGIDADVMALRSGRRMELAATRSRGYWSAESAQFAAAQLTRVFGRPYAVESVADGVEARFVRVPKFKMNCAADSRPRIEGMTCGDCHAIRRLKDDRMVLALSDGMGSGEDAASESEQTLRLLTRFLAADVPRQSALRTVNELMLAREDSDMFATVDLCVVDLVTGMAEFSKLAACRSLIWRKGQLLEVEGGRLPLGILSGVQPAVRRVELVSGDILLMASDGVMDVLSDKDFLDCIGEEVGEDEIARRIIHRTEECAGTSRRDDMTCVCARVS